MIVARLNKMNVFLTVSAVWYNPKVNFRNSVGAQVSSKKVFHLRFCLPFRREVGLGRRVEWKRQILTSMNCCVEKRCLRKQMHTKSTLANFALIVAVVCAVVRLFWLLSPSFFSHYIWAVSELLRRDPDFHLNQSDITTLFLILVHMYLRTCMYARTYIAMLMCSPLRAVKVHLLRTWVHKFFLVHFFALSVYCMEGIVLKHLSWAVR